MMKIVFMLFISCLLSHFAMAGMLGFVDLPKGCHSRQVYPCQVRVNGGFLAIEQGGQSLQLADQSALSFLASNEVQILAGSLWVRKSQDLTVRMSPLLALSLSSGEFFFSRQSDSALLVRNLAGEVGFESDRVFANEVLPVGFQNWYGPLNTNGQISRGMIRPIDMAAFLKDWLSMSGLSRAEMRHQIESYRESWKDGLELSVELYSQVVSRRIAAVEEKERKKQERLSALRQERLRLRNMYRAKNGLEPSDHP